MPDNRALVVDDNPSMRKLLGMVLTQMGGIQVDYARNGREAVSLHGVNQYDLIILDNAMPEMTGLQFLRTNHDSLIASNTAVIMVTAAPDQEMIKAARNSELRLDDIVVKPFDVQLMKDRVQKIIDRYKAQGRRNRIQPEVTPPKSFATFSPNLDGKMLSILTSVTKNIATVSMIGMLHNDDRDVINCFFKTLRDLPGDSLLLDLSGVVGIDEFGLGTLLCVNGMAATVGKETYLIAEGSMVAERIKSVGISEIVPMCGHWSDVAFDGRNNRDAANQASLAAAALPMVGLGGGDGFSAVAAHSAHSARSVAGGCAL